MIPEKNQSFQFSFNMHHLYCILIFYLHNQLHTRKWDRTVTHVPVLPLSALTKIYTVPHHWNKCYINMVARETKIIRENMISLSLYIYVYLFIYFSSSGNLFRAQCFICMLNTMVPMLFFLVEGWLIHDFGAWWGDGKCNVSLWEEILRSEFGSMSGWSLSC